MKMKIVTALISLTLAAAMFTGCGAAAEDTAGAATAAESTADAAAETWYRIDYNGEVAYVNGKYVQKAEAQPDWYRIEYNDVMGYVNAAYVEAVETPPTEVSTASEAIVQ